MRVLALSLDHRTADMALRERVALGAADAGALLNNMRARYPQAELAVLSTCNRTELYVARPTHEPPDGDALRRGLAEQTGVDLETLARCCMLREQRDAVAHLFRVASGLESLVVGEVQVLGQVRKAYELAAETGTLGGVLHPVFQSAIATAKRVHSETAIGRGQHSVGSIAVRLAQGIFDQFEDKHVLAIGAGDVSKTVLRRLYDLKPQRLTLCNRSADRAVRLAQACRFPSDCVRPFDALDRLMAEADIIVTATGSPEPIIDVPRFRPVVKRRRRRPVCLIDLALPRDVAPEVGGLSNVYLYNIDDLQSVVDQTRDERRGETDKCNAIITPAVDQCMKQVQHRDVGVMIKHLRQKLHDLGDLEQERTLRLLQRAMVSGDTDGAERALEQHTRRLINKVLHLPLSTLEQTEGPAPLGFYAAALRRLFDLPERPDEPTAKPTKPLPDTPDAQASQTGKADTKTPDNASTPHNSSLSR